MKVDYTQNCQITMYVIPINSEYTIESEPELEESSMIFFPTSFSSHCFLRSLDMLDSDSIDVFRAFWMSLRCVRL